MHPHKSKSLTSYPNLWGTATNLTIPHRDDSILWKCGDHCIFATTAGLSQLTMINSIFASVVYFEPLCGASELVLDRKTWSQALQEKNKWSHCLYLGYLTTFEIKSPLQCLLSELPKKISRSIFFHQRYLISSYGCLFLLLSTLIYKSHTAKVASIEVLLLTLFSHAYILQDRNIVCHFQQASWSQSPWISGKDYILLQIS